MVIYFLRHGAYRKTPGTTDGLSHLTEEGAGQIEIEARAMVRLGVSADAIISSPLARARQTAEIVARALGLLPALTVDERLSPGFGPSQLRDIIHDHARAGALLLVGHEPDFSSTIGSCTGGLRVAMGKGTLARVELDKPVSLSGSLAWLLPAETLVP
jgi:phosphohistidine phosphatase